MFRHNDGYFRRVACPELTKTGRCSIVNCFFQHEKPKPVSDQSNHKDQNDKRQASSPEETPSKRLKSDKDITVLIPKDADPSISRSVRSVNVRKIATKYQEQHEQFPNRSAIEKEYELAVKSGNINAYNEAVDTFLNGPKRVVSDPKLVMPKEVHPQPATIPVRKKNIQIMIDTIKKTRPDAKTPVLESIEEEFQVASKTTPGTYMQTFKRRVYQLAHPEKFKPVLKTPTNEQYVSGLTELKIPVATLKKYGYITEIPKIVEITQDRTCRRCNNEFKLADILKPTQCHYHPGKVNKKNKTTKVHDCCGRTVGGDTETCTVSKHHVFYWSNEDEMHTANPFKLTKDLFKPNRHSFKALGIDCEMGFTTEGFELLRITAVDFLTGEEVIDLLVRPHGQVIDLNTKWSGIAEIKEEAMSFSDLIQLLGSVMDSNTILIGHGLENDMNSMRLIHENIVDTAILYPKQKTSPTFRYPLKYLTFTYLGRVIQTGEHDSKEDSIAAIDVVKYFIRKDLEKV